MNQQQIKEMMFGPSSRGDSIRRRIVSSTCFQNKRPLPENPFYVKKELLITQRPSETHSRGSDRNIKFKLETLEEKITEISSDVYNLRQQNRQLIELVSLLKQDLAYHQLLDMKQQLQDKMLSFSKQLRASQHGDQFRYNQIHEDLGSLWDQTEQRRSQLFQLNLRVEALEAKMGFGDSYQLSLF